MKPLAVSPDVERLVVDYLVLTLLAYEADVTVGVNVPAEWSAGVKPHVQVASDGAPRVRYPIFSASTVRVTAWHASTSTAKALAALCEGLLCSHPGSPSVGSVQPLTGVLPTRDPTSGAQLATVTVRVNLRYTVQP